MTQWFFSLLFVPAKSLHLSKVLVFSPSVSPTLERAITLGFKSILTQSWALENISNLSIDVYMLCLLHLLVFVFSQM